MTIEDIFGEEKITPTVGLIRRYKDRALVELTTKCPVDCEFCFRKWKKDREKQSLTKEEINKIIKFIEKDKNIKEIILSGGEPLFYEDLFIYAFNKIKNLEQIKSIRIHTRAVVTKPELIKDTLLKELEKNNNKIVYVSIHINHSSELTKECQDAILKLRKAGVILYSQSVFLKDTNDSVEILKELFSNLTYLGVRPYNIYHCNPIKGLEKFIVPLEKEIKIMTDLRKEISGLACPVHIIDALGSAHKIPVPINSWDFDKSIFRDFDGRVLETEG